MTILISVFTIGYKGKTVQMEQASEKHRTSIAYFLNHGRWNEDILEQCVKAEVIRRIYEEAERTGKPIYCIVDDTISSKTKPSSRAMHPIEDAYFHHSHLKKKKDYGHQAVGVMLSCNGIVLNYAIVMYDKSRSKIQIVCDIAKEIPEAPIPSSFLCDCWTGHPLPFPVGFAAMQKRIAVERISYTCHCGAAHVPLVNVLSFAA